MCRKGGRVVGSHWDLDASAADPPLRVHVIKSHQQYETPAAVVATVRRLWRPTFDAMATPLSAICAAYATLEDDVMTPDLIPRGSVVYANPAYAPTEVKNGTAGIDIHLTKLIQVDVQQRGSTLVALLPTLTHTDWYERLVGACHEIHHVRGLLVFRNPYTDLEAPKKGYLWQCRSYDLCVWRPAPLPAAPAVSWLTLDASKGDEMIHIRTCKTCGRVRVLPRWVAEPESEKLRQGRFQCENSPDACYSSCSVPEFLLCMV